MATLKDDGSKADRNEPPGADTRRRVLPLLPLRDLIVFPYMVVPLFVGREKSIAAIDEALARDKEIFLAALSRVATFTAADSTLALETKDGPLLRFAAR